ncbi:hypothetical protein K0M31_016562 [Melipona bicolor]|uniref:Uncharacterized protein n=1 Tax=Melipona bicolor TaxID=60889 RepID=A0AA40FEJ3_9HYME|nr:hypothetical protein K0M31_016562 [Melipona bicolor]
MRVWSVACASEGTEKEEGKWNRLDVEKRKVEKGVPRRMSSDCSLVHEHWLGSAREFLGILAFLMPSNGSRASGGFKYDHGQPPPGRSSETGSIDSEKSKRRSTAFLESESVHLATSREKFRNLRNFRGRIGCAMKFISL